ncbi:hypothetical protein, partial [Paraglaciecola arctica]|uniref:hypothetical protein n=1 Tax=Paraglaciecola arctica TaxID=1128911 RepID=UPI0005869497
IQQGQKTVGFCSFVAILANNFLPVNWALGTYMKKENSSLLLIPYLLIATPIAFIAQLFEKSVVRSKDEVEGILNEMEKNEPSEYLWDEFLSTPIKDKKLDKIREQVEILWAYEDFQTQNSSNFTVLNSRGLTELKSMLIELENDNST